MATLYDLYTSRMSLTIDGQDVPLTAAFALRFVDVPGEEPTAELYRNGRRVTKAWTLELRLDHAADAAGGNANTE